jgi:hypothetical protein
MVETAIATWTTAAIAGILPLHACPARCGAQRRCGTAKLRSAPCLPFDSSKLLRATHAGSQPDADQRNSNISSASADRLRLLCRQSQRWQERSGRHPTPFRRGFRQPSTSGPAAAGGADAATPSGGGDRPTDRRGSSSRAKSHVRSGSHADPPASQPAKVGPKSA